MKIKKYILNQNLKCRKTAFVDSRRAAHKRAKGSGAPASVDAIAAQLARNLRDKDFGDVITISSIN